MFAAHETSGGKMEQAMNVAGVRAFFNSLPAHMDNVHVAVSDGDPNGEGFHEAEPFPAERVLVEGVGRTLAIVFGREYGHRKQYRVVDPGVRTVARIGREGEMARAA